MNLHKKAKKERRLTQAEISAIEKYASSFASIVGTDQMVIDFPSSKFPKYGIKVPSELVLNKDSAVLFVRGKWLVDTVTERCVGKWDDGGELLTVFPNPVVLVTDAARMVSEATV